MHFVDLAFLPTALRHPSTASRLSCTMIALSTIVYQLTGDAAATSRLAPFYMLPVSSVLVAIRSGQCQLVGVTLCATNPGSTNHIRTGRECRCGRR